MWLLMVKRSASVVLAIAYALCLVSCRESSRGKLAFTDRQAIEAVLGEARGEGYAGMYAVSCALRNRASLKGVYGRKRHVDARLWQRASKAWYTSEWGEDVTKGATHWENVREFGYPWWAKGMRRTAVIGKHQFFVER